MLRGRELEVKGVDKGFIVICYEEVGVLKVEFAREGMLLLQKPPEPFLFLVIYKTLEE